MSVSHLVANAKSAIQGAISGQTRSGSFDRSLWALALLVGPVLGIALAFCIVNQQWHLVLALLLLAPALVLFNAYPFGALIIWLLLNAFLQEPPTRAYRMMYWVVHRALPPAVLALVILALLLRVTRRRRQVKLGLPEVCMLAYLALAVLNVLWFHASPLQQLYLLYDEVFIPFCLYCLIRFTLSSENDVRRLLPVAFVLVLTQFTVGLLSWLAPGVLPSAWLIYQGQRATGTLAYPHAYTTTLLFFGLLLFHAAVTEKSLLLRAAWFSASGLSFIGVFLSFSRGSWLGAVVAGVGLLFAYPKIALRSLLLLLVVLAVLGGGILSDQMAFAQERLASESTARDRLVIWDAGLRLIEARPLFGWGYGNYGLYAGQLQRRVLNYVTENPHASHNSYIGLAAELGLPALFLFMLPLLWWLVHTLKVWPRMAQEGFWSRRLLVVFWLVILANVVVTFFSDMRHSTYGMGMWWITLGLIANLIDLHPEPASLTLPKGIQSTSQKAFHR